MYVLYTVWGGYIVMEDEARSGARRIVKDRPCIGCSLIVLSNQIVFATLSRPSNNQGVISSTYDWVQPHG